MVQQHVLAVDGGEDVGRAFGSDGISCAFVVGTRGVVQVGAVDPGEVEQPAEVERRGQAVHLLFGHRLAHQQAERHVVHVVGDLEADGRTEPAAQQLLLERLDEVLGLVLLDLDVSLRVTRNTWWSRISMPGNRSPKGWR